MDDNERIYTGQSADKAAGQPIPPERQTTMSAEGDVAAANDAPDAGASGKKTSVSRVLGNKTIEDVIRREAKEEQDTSSPFSISKTLGGVIIARAFQKQIGLVLLVCVFLIIYINNRYVCQKRMVEIDKIEARMVDAKYKATVCTSILTEKSRESHIMRLLQQYGDSTLTIPNEPPYLIRVEE